MDSDEENDAAYKILMRRNELETNDLANWIALE